MLDDSPGVDPLPVMRALSHPLRVRILTSLPADRPVRVCDVADAVGIAPNAASFHLKQLEKGGLVARTEGPAGSTKRETWYAPVRNSMFTHDPSTVPQDQHAAHLAQLRTYLMAEALDRVEAVCASVAAQLETKPESSKASGVHSFAAVHLTHTQATAAIEAWQSWWQQHVTAHEAEEVTAETRPYLTAFTLIEDVRPHASSSAVRARHDGRPEGRPS